MTSPPLTAPEVIAAAAQRGLEISERTFRYYGVVGLLPRPLKRPHGDEDARVHYYPADIVDRLVRIRTLQAQGYSLKQIKSWLSIEPPASAPVDTESAGAAPPASGVAISELRGLLCFFSGEALRSAEETFLEATLVDDREEVLRQAAVAWYAGLVADLTGGAHTREQVQAALAQMTPLEVDALIEPLRRMRDEERRRRAFDEEAPLVTVLRVLALRRARGISLSDEARARLSGYAQSVEALKQRLGQLSRAQKTVAPQALTGLRKSLDRLSHVIGMLERDGDVNAILRSLSRASTELGAATSILRGLRQLASTREVEAET